MSQLNSKALFWLSAASLQVSVLFGGAVSAPSSMAQAEATTPLTTAELATYSTMSLVTFCRARTLDVGFEDSLRIALYAEVITVFKKHGGKAEGLKAPIAEKNYAAGAEFRLVGRALETCPKLVPPDQKSKFTKFAEKVKKQLTNH